MWMMIMWLGAMISEKQAASRNWNQLSGKVVNARHEIANLNQLVLTVVGSTCFVVVNRNSFVRRRRNEKWNERRMLLDIFA